jgi:large exoprotein involved in heme utilization and adhesion
VKVRAEQAISLADNAGIFSTVEAGGKSRGGDIEINAASLSIKDGSLLASATRGASDTQPAGQGNAGNIDVKVTGQVNIGGEKNGFSSGIRSGVGIGTKGNGGNITINASSFNLQDRGFIFAPTLGQGNAGNIKINANEFVKISGSIDGIFGSGLYVTSTNTKGITGDIIITSPKITLDNTGTLNAESTSGNGGNINLTSDLLLLRRDAQISTNAGTAQQGGDGGNIDINSKTIVAIPQEDSDITANAFEGKGGNININTQGIFGIEPASANIPLRNDITASSELGITGNINLNAPDNSSIQNSLSDLQQNPIDTNALIANSCIARSRKRESTFNITGAGGLPQRPGDTAASNYPTGEVQNLADKIQSSEWKPGEAIVEPQGVYELPSGQLILSRECS